MNNTMKYLILIMAFSWLGISCGGEAPPQEEEVSPELIEEIKTVEAENEAIETTVEDLEESTEELDQLLEEL